MDVNNVQEDEAISTPVEESCTPVSVDVHTTPDFSYSPSPALPLHDEKQEPQVQERAEEFPAYNNDGWQSLEAIRKRAAGVKRRIKKGSRGKGKQKIKK